MSEPRAKTEDEVRTEFLQHLAVMVNYWRTVIPDEEPEDLQLYRMDGLVHSILTALDGCAMAVPGFAVIPFPAEEDEEFLRKEGTDWYPFPKGLYELGLIDIAGGLHEQWWALKRE